MTWRYTQEQLLGMCDLLSEMQREVRNRHSLDIYEFLILSQVAAGDVRHKPWDATSLAAHIHLPRETAARKLARLEAMGYIRHEQRGRRVVYLRHGGIKTFRSTLETIVDRVVQYVSVLHRNESPKWGQLSLTKDRSARR